jgi:hypothetical protein
MKRNRSSRRRVREDAVDLNYLFHRQQVERSLAERTTSPVARRAHEELAKRYEERVEQLTGDAFNFLSND